MAAPALSALFADVGARHGDRLALASPQRRRTYRELAAAVDALASRLAPACAHDPGPIGLVLSHGEALATATFAAFRLGRAVVPIDPTMPAPRRDAILDDAGAAAVVWCDGTASRLGLAARSGLGTVVSHPRVVPPDAVAMLLYTSGSTGAPKGVVYSHDAIAARVAHGDRFPIGPDDRLGVFGAAGMNLFRALLRGAALLSWDVGRDGVAGIADWIAREEITQLHAIPTLLRRLAAALPSGRTFPRLRRVSITGEPLFAADVAALRRLFPPPATLLNGLGTTEAGTFCQWTIADDELEAAVPVGAAVDGMTVSLHGDDGGLVSDGAVGEIVVGGALLSAGYWRRPELEACRFVDDPRDPARRRYRTGDLGRRRADGALVHLGRRDHQVKIRGVRIEPSEVEAALRAHPSVRDVAVAGMEDGGPRLAACVAVDLRRAELARELARWLRTRVPAAMVPDGWTFVDALPVTPGGKVDRRALPAPPPRSPTPHTGIVTRFLQQASATPDAVAYRHGASTMRFAELERRSARLAMRLRAHGVEPGGLVALAVERSPSFAVGLLAVLRAGGACLPLDPRGPHRRNHAMLAESGARWLLASPDLPLEAIPDVLRIDPDASATAATELAPPDGDPRRLAFVLYTSGSAGHPKGVELSEGQVLHRLRWDWTARPFAAGEVACQRGPTGFVDSLAEWLGPLLQGVPIEIVPDALLRRPQALVDALAAARVSRILLVPSQLELLLQSIPDLGARVPALRLWTASGEPLTRATAARFHAALPDAVLWNVYGATEAWDATCHRLERDAATVPIGRPLPGMRAYVLDDALAPVPIGVAGDLYVAGDGLALGYRGDDALTHARFIANPFTPGVADRLYRTGDRARRTDDGGLEHLGRADRQVQVLGVRVELGEVEAALAAHVAVQEGAAVQHDGRVVAYVVAAPGGLDVARLRAHLRERLVAAAMPREIVALEALPRNARGKIDRGALADPERIVRLRAPSAPPPAVLPTELEETVLQVFADLLQQAPIGVDDDFFDLGGDSLLAVQLVAELEALTGRTVSLDAIAAAPTPRAIAAAVAGGGFAWDDAGCLSLHPDAAGPPLFGLCGAWGFGVRLLRLGRALGDDVPLHALQPPGMTWPEGIELPGIAAHYAAEMERLQPDGPYRLIGTSFGGVIALEVALQLEARGREVALLAVIDSALPGSPLQPRLEFAPERATRLEVVGHRVYMAHLHAAPSYRPAAQVAAPVVYYRCAESTHAHHRSWRALAQREPAVVTVPGGHGAFHVEPQLGHIAADLRVRLFAPAPVDDAVPTLPLAPPPGATTSPSLFRRLLRRARALKPRFDGRPSRRPGVE